MAVTGFESGSEFPPLPSSEVGRDMIRSATLLDVDIAPRGPIEPTFLVAASDARPDIIAVADYVCDGTADEVQINAALTAVAALAQGGIVQLSSGLFSCADQIVHTSGSKQLWLRGAGRNATLIDTSGNAPSTREGVIYLIAPYSMISDLGVDVSHNGYRNAIYLDVLGTAVGALTRVTVGMFSPSVTDVAAAISVGNDIEVYDVEVTESSKGDGINVFGARVNIGSVQIHSATAEGTGGGWGIVIGTANINNCRIHDSFIENCATAGIWIGSDNCVVTGNDATDGIVINGTADDTVLGNNIGTITDNGTNTINSDFPDNFFSVFSSADVTKILELDVSGVTTGTTRTLVVPDADGTIALEGAATDADAIHDNVDGEIVLVAEKVSPVGADVALIEDSEASNAKKRVQLANLPDTSDHATPIATHAGLPDSHHDETHDVASHGDTTATGAELETLTDGSNADSLHVHAASSPALDDITDVTLTTVGTGEVLAKSAGDWINRTLTEAGIAAESHGSHDHDTPIAVHAAIVGSHHTKYTDGEVDAIVATHDAIVDAHHTKYTDAEVDAIVATHDAITDAHHGKYLDSEAVTAMGAKGDANALHHDRYTDGEADTRAALQDHNHATPIATHAALPNAHHAESHTVVSHSDTTATGAELETLTDGSETALHSHAGGGASGAAFSELMLIGA